MNRYKKLRINDYDGDLSRRWYIQYLYQDKDTLKWIPVREWISSAYKTKASRYLEAKNQLKKIEAKLVLGYDPLTQQENVTIRVACNRILLLKQAVLGGRTYTDYKSASKHFCDWLDIHNLGGLYPSQLSKHICETYFDWCLINQKLSARTHNNRLNNLKALFTEMVAKNLIEYNVFKNVKCLATPEPEIVAYTDSEMKLLRDKLEYGSPCLWLTALFVHYAFIRPAELVRLKIACLNFDNKLISLSGNQTKNKRSNIILMPDPLYNRLIEMGYHEKDKNLFIVSNGHSLSPGEKPIKPTRISEVWKREVIDKLKIKKGIYIMKHTGAGRLLDNGAGPREAQLQIRHHSLEETLEYLNKYSNRPNEGLRKHFKEIQ